MVLEPSSEHAAEDAEVTRLANARLVHVCHLAGSAAEQVMVRAAREQRNALVAIALRVLATIPADLAAGRVVSIGPGRLDPRRDRPGTDRRCRRQYGGDARVYPS